MAVLLNGGLGAAIADWRGEFLDNRHRKFVKKARHGGAIGCNGVFGFLVFRHIHSI